MNRSITFAVLGLPRPQGSLKLHALPNGKQAARYPAAVYEWRAQVQQAAAGKVDTPFEDAVELRLGFDLPRPAFHYGTGRNAGVVKPSAPSRPTTMPDLDKLVRCVCDALTDAGVWHDDAQVTTIIAAKRYVDIRPGVHVSVVELTVTPAPAWQQLALDLEDA